MANGYRVCWNIFPIFFSLAAFVFTLMVIISGTSAKNDLADIYFMRINTTDIIPSSVAESTALNTVAQSLGLHDFYQNSLWGYCEGYGNGTNVTACSKPTSMYVFDPVEIFSSELLSGASVSVPASIQNDLDKVRTASRWMFALYIVGVCLSFLTLVIGLTALCSRVGSVFTTLVAFLAFLFITAATLVAQIMFIVYRNVINNAITELNVTASLGTTMFAISWAAAAAALFAFIGFMFGICCGTGANRNKRVGRRSRGEKPVFEEGIPLARNQMP